MYPIIVAISGACAMCAFQCMRHLTQSPDVHITKTDRAMGVKEDKHFFKEGERFRDHAVRRYGKPLSGSSPGRPAAHCTRLLQASARASYAHCVGTARGQLRRELGRAHTGSAPPLPCGSAVVLHSTTPLTSTPSRRTANASGPQIFHSLNSKMGCA